MKIRYSVVLKSKIELEQMDLTQARLLTQKRAKKGSWEAEFEKFLDKGRFDRVAADHKAPAFS